MGLLQNCFVGKKPFWNALFPLRGDNEIIFLKIKNWGVWGIVFCVSKTRQYPNCGEVWRKICFVIPQRSTRFYMREDETNISPKNSLTLSHQRLIAPGRTRRRGSVFAVLRRDKAGGGTRQRKREAGGTPGGVSPCKKTQNKLSPHIGNRAIKKIHFHRSPAYEKNYVYSAVFQCCTVVCTGLLGLRQKNQRKLYQRQQK